MNKALWRTLVPALALLAGLTLGMAHPVHAADPVHWAYEGAEGPDHWCDLSADFALCCSGKEQTPIDIPSSAPVNPDNITFNYHASAVNIFNNGHTIQVNVDPGSTITVGGVTYDLKQFHYHLKSEHTLSGSPTDMELHFVHSTADGKLAVVGVMLRHGAENTAMAPVFSHLPATKGDPAAVPGASVNPMDMLPAQHTYYSYNGSLTTPPCSEGVRWLLMNTPVELSEAQITAFETIIHENARPVQPMNGREFVMIGNVMPAALPKTGGEFPLVELIYTLGLLTSAAGAYALRRR